MYRSSFVSNSSSSSFILAVRRGHKVGEINGGVFAMLAKELTRFLQSCSLTSFDQIVHDKLIDELGNDYATEMRFDNLLREDVAEVVEEMTGLVREMLGEDENLDDWGFYRGWVGNEGTELYEQMLYEEQIVIHEENVRLG